MPVSTSAKNFTASLATRRVAATVAVLLLAAALAITSLSNDDLTKGVDDFTKGVGDSVTRGVNRIKTVATMFDERSPGERVQGALASLKHKRHPAVHERALAKVRRPGPLAAVLHKPVIPPITPPPAATPLYTIVAAGPPVLVPNAIVPGGPPVIPGGPPIFASIPPPGGGGGVITPPPIVTLTPTVPEVPGIPAVPEPATWAMMLVGFALMGRALRRNRVTAAEPSAS